jgi:hypothetical protein
MKENKAGLGRSEIVKMLSIREYVFLKEYEWRGIQIMD